jgi:hypothetical protein
MDKNFIKSYLPFASGFLIFLGFYNLQCYYWWFGINIYNYVSTGELILSFISIIIELLLIGLISLLFWYLMTFSHNVLFYYPNPKKLKEELDFHKRNKTIINVLEYLYFIFGNIASIAASIIIFSIYLIFLIIILTQTRNFRFALDYVLNTWIAIIVIIICSISLIYLIKTFYSENKISYKRNSIKFFIYKKLRFKITKTTSTSFIVLISILTLFWGKNSYKASYVLSGRRNTKVSFVYKKKIFSTNDTIIFLGETKDYLFFRNIKLSDNLIFKRSEISFLNFKTKVLLIDQ